MVLNINAKLDPWKTYCALSSELIEHCERVAKYTKVLYELSIKANLFYGQLSEHQLKHIQNAVIYHDIGKSVFKESFLNKKGVFTKEERRLIQYHVEFGLILFKESMQGYRASLDSKIFLTIVMEAICQHHERFDGKGYPLGLKGNDISPVGQICALCDYYDVLTMHRSYHTALSHANGVNLIKYESGKYFNPLLVKLFVEHQNLFKKHVDNINLK